MPFVTEYSFNEIYKKLSDKKDIELESKNGFKFCVCNQTLMRYLAMTLCHCDEQDDELDKILNGNTDLIPNQYEGGFKIWEGLFDLIEYLKSNTLINENNRLFQEQDEINILDLGCGSGLLSTYIAKQIRINLNKKIKFKIYLQDYNENVIRYFTVPNVILNEMDDFEDKKELQSIIESNYIFMFGDWKEVNEDFTKQNVRFDWILSAETLYCEDNYQKLFEIFQCRLRKPNGKVWIATKSHYFGVGGGVYSFLDFVDNQIVTKRKKFDSNSIVEPVLQADIVQNIDASLVRHIVELKWNHSVTNLS